MFFKSQYGFRKNYCTQHAILEILNKVQTNIDKKLYSCGIFIDLKKATVYHNVLLCKLHRYRIRGIINAWFSSYYQGRTQSTQIGSSLVTHGFHAEAIIRLKAKYQCSTLLNGTTAEALVLVGCVEFVFMPAFGY